MKHMNRTLLLALLSRCQHLLLQEMDVDGGPNNNNNNDSSTASGTAPSPVSTGPAPPAAHSNARNSYDNAYFYILVVMFFYSFLSLTVFKRFIHGKAKEDPYAELMSNGLPLAPKFNAGPSAVGFDFEDESV